MDGDPWFWTTLQVVDFFHSHAKSYIQDLPNARLPDLATFVRTLADNDVSGAVLLTAVDATFLRIDCGIGSLGNRATVLHCILKLRAQSRAYVRQDDLKGPLPLLSATTTADTDTSVIGTADDPDTTAVGQNLRNDERHVEDARGRKRRKLVLLQSESITNASPDVPRTSYGYLRDSALPVDGLFFGDTALGQQIESLEPDAEVSTQQTHQGDGKVTANFQFQASSNSGGNHQYVWSQMRRFLNSDAIEVERHGHAAFAVLPYRVTLLAKNKPQSAIVYQMRDDERDVVAVKENAAFIHSQHTYNGLAQASHSTEWDFLIGKYQDTRELPTYNQSEEEEISSSLADELEAEEQELQQEQRGILTQLQVADITRQAIEMFVDEWTKKLPRLEEKTAWQVWKKMKQSKTIRNNLIEDASARITHLNARLAKFELTFLQDEWKSERDLRATCEGMRATVDDREELLWKQEVWSRRKEPYHVSQPGHHPGIAAHCTHRRTGHNLVLPDDDRISLSPSRRLLEQHAGDMDYVRPAESPDNIDRQLMDDPILEPETAYDASESMSADTDESGSEQYDDLPNEDESRSLRDPFSPSSPVANNNRDTEQRYSATPEAEKSDSGDLPSPSALVPHGSKLEYKLQTTPQQHERVTTQLEPIDLTMLSSDDSITNKFLAPSEPDYKGSPIDATLAQVKSWNVQELAKRGDQFRVLIKLLFMAGREYRERLQECYRQLRRDKFIRQLENAVGALKTGQTAEIDEEYRDTMTRCASLSIAWLICVPEVIRRPVQPQEWAIVNKEGIKLSMFVDQMAGVLQKRGTKLFSTPKNAQVQASISISSDDPDNVSAHQTPHKTRKRLVPANEVAQEARCQALLRQEKFAMRSQSLNGSQELAAMVEASTSISDISVNPAKEEGQDYIYIQPRIAEKIKAHQIDGIRFMWREITNDSRDGEQGCILAHTMGLGKTLQTIALLACVNQAASSSNPKVRLQLPAKLRPDNIAGKRQLRMLVLSPPALLHNWQSEINKWAPEALTNVFIVDAGLLAIKVRMETLNDWHRFGGVMLMSYDMFRSFVMRKANSKSKKLDEYGPRLDAILLQGPEMVVADEAHILRNKDSLTSRAVGMIRTESRIGLTGTPMSNNIQEIYSLVSFVAPGYFGNISNFRQDFAEPIAQGTYAESTPFEIRKSKKKLEVLQREIAPKVNRADITVLRGSLKSKVEFVITLPLMEMQKTIYNRFIDFVTTNNADDAGTTMRIFGWLAILTVLTNHPLAFKRKLLSPIRAHSKQPNEVIDTTEYTESDEEPDQDPGLPEEVSKLLTDEITENYDPGLSAKTAVFMEILEMSEQCGDKVLAFSSSIPTLDYIGGLLNKRHIPFGRIDGHIPSGKRLAIVEQFEKHFNLMLISTRAGGTGLNIQKANRVVIFDFGFNPAWEQQAIGRAYRLGQTKPVYVYRFITGGTFEDRIYEKQLFKTSLSLRVVDKKNPRRSAARDMSEYLNKPVERAQKSLENWLGKDPDVLDQIIKRRGFKSPLIRALSTMETLHEDAGDVPLTEDELREVDEEIEVGKMSRARGRQIFTAPAPASAPDASPAPQPTGMPVAVPSSSFQPRQAQAAQSSRFGGPTAMQGYGVLNPVFNTVPRQVQQPQLPHQQTNQTQAEQTTTETVPHPFPSAR